MKKPTSFATIRTSFSESGNKHILPTVIMRFGRNFSFRSLWLSSQHPFVHNQKGPHEFRVCEVLLLILHDAAHVRLPNLKIPCFCHPVWWFLYTYRRLQSNLCGPCTQNILRQKVSASATLKYFTKDLHTPFTCYNLLRDSLN